MEGIRIQHNEFNVVEIPKLPYEVLKVKYKLFQGERETGYLIQWNDKRYQLFIAGVSLYISNDDVQLSI